MGDKREAELERVRLIAAARQFYDGRFLRIGDAFTAPLSDANNLIALRFATRAKSAAALLVDAPPERVAEAVGHAIEAVGHAATAPASEELTTTAPVKRSRRGRSRKHASKMARRRDTDG